MILQKCVLLFGLILALLANSISSKRGGHSYPQSSGLSGGGHQSGGLSGGAHGYPPSSNNHGYPPSSGLSGSNNKYPASKPAEHHTTNVYNNYNYAPPAQISYTPVHGGAPVNYPVYHGTPPSYVYQYKDSGSKYGTLLAGLALMNLGTLGVAAYAAHEASQNHGSYTPQKGEVCKFAVKKENGDYEETRIDCQIISGLILQDMEEQKSGNQSAITTTTTVTNVTVVNTTHVGGEQTTAVPVPGNVLYAMLPNGTLVPVNTTEVKIPDIPDMPGVLNTTMNETAPASSSSSVVTTTTTNTTLVSALDVKGKPVEVTPGMQCFVIRNSPTSNMKKTVPCGLLQTYADKSIRPSSATRNVPMFTLVAAIVVYCFA